MSDIWHHHDRRSPSNRHQVDAIDSITDSSASLINPKEISRQQIDITFFCEL
jgi:hypothetical protein